MSTHFIKRSEASALPFASRRRLVLPSRLRSRLSLDQSTTPAFTMQSQLNLSFLEKLKEDIQDPENNFSDIQTGLTPKTSSVTYEFFQDHPAPPDLAVTGDLSKSMEYVSDADFNNTTPDGESLRFSLYWLSLSYLVLFILFQ